MSLGKAALALSALALSALALLAQGCAGPSYPTEVPPPSRPAVTPAPEPTPRNLPVLPMPGAAPIPAEPRSSAAVRDACGASNLQALVGRPRSLIPVPVDPSRQRVACTTCPAAQDVDPGRITFLFDARSGLIQTIKCG